MGMPLDAFTEQLYAGLVGGKEQIGIGALGPPGAIDMREFEEVMEKRAKMTDTLTGIMLESYKDQL
jgi:hypothetical protein